MNCSNCGAETYGEEFNPDTTISHVDDNSIAGTNCDRETMNDKWEAINSIVQGICATVAVVSVVWIVAWCSVQ